MNNSNVIISSLRIIITAIRRNQNIVLSKRFSSTKTHRHGITTCSFEIIALQLHWKYASYGLCGKTADDNFLDTVFLLSLKH